MYTIRFEKKPRGLRSSGGLGHGDGSRTTTTTTGGNRGGGVGGLSGELLPLDPAQDVDPGEGTRADVHDAELGRHQQEVDGLRRQPEQTGPGEGRHEFLLALLDDAGLALHQGHSWEEREDVNISFFVAC